MVKNFFSTPNLLGRLLIVMIFAGGVVFAGAFDGFIVETEATSCCAAGCGADEIFYSSSSCCNCEGNGNCGDCPRDDACDGRKKGCADKCNYPGNCHECNNVCGGPTGSDRIECSGGTNGCCTEK